MSTCGVRKRGPGNGRHYYTIELENRHKTITAKRPRMRVCINNAVYNGLMISKRVEGVEGEVENTRKRPACGRRRVRRRRRNRGICCLITTAHRSLFKIQFGPKPILLTLPPFDSHIDDTPGRSAYSLSAGYRTATRYYRRHYVK